MKEVSYSPLTLICEKGTQVASQPLILLNVYLPGMELGLTGGYQEDTIPSGR